MVWNNVSTPSGEPTPSLLGIKWIQGFRSTGARYRSWVLTLASATRSWVLTAVAGYAIQPSRGRKTQIDLEKKDRFGLPGMGPRPSAERAASGQLADGDGPAEARSRGAVMPTAGAGAQ